MEHSECLPSVGQAPDLCAQGPWMKAMRGGGDINVVFFLISFLPMSCRC